MQRLLGSSLALTSVQVVLDIVNDSQGFNRSDIVLQNVIMSMHLMLAMDDVQKGCIRWVGKACPPAATPCSLGSISNRLDSNPLGASTTCL